MLLCVHPVPSISSLFSFLQHDPSECLDSGVSVPLCWAEWNMAARMQCGRVALTPCKCEEDWKWKEGEKMQGSSRGGVLCHRRSARREHWLLTFKTSVWWRDACSFPAASHPSGPQSAMIDEATGSVTPLCKACLPFAMLSLSRCLPLLPLLQVLRYTGGWWIFCMSVYVCACSLHILISSPKCLCLSIAEHSYLY